MTGPRPSIVATCLLAATVQVLPADRRPRYHEELRTELCEFTGIRQFVAAAGLLRGSLSLRHALLDRDVQRQAAAGRPLRCRLGRHEYVGERDVNLAKGQHMSYRCVRCGGYFERKRDEEEGFDMDALRRNANYFGGGGIGF